MTPPRTEARDRGLGRVSKVTRATLVGGLVAAGALSAIAAHGAPGRTHAPKGASSAGNGPIGLQPPAGGSQQGGDVSGSGLQPPVGAPGPVPGGGGSGQVVSGGS